VEDPTIYTDEPTLDIHGGDPHQEVDLPLYVALYGLPNMDGALLVYEKDAEPHGWIVKGRVKTTDYDCNGYEVVNIYSGTLEFVKPNEVHRIEELPS
jgi:hypothetical protein